MGRPKTIETDKLLEIARELLRTRGHKATIRDVAKAVGVSPGILYQRFKDKEELFLAALAPSVPALVDENDDASDPRAFLASFGARVKDHFREVIPAIIMLGTHADYSKNLSKELHRYNRVGEIAAILRLRMQQWEKAGLIKPAQPGVFVAIFVHVLHSMVLREHLSGEKKVKTKPEQMRPFIDALWTGLGPR